MMTPSRLARAMAAAAAALRRQASTQLASAAASVESVSVPARTALTESRSEQVEHQRQDRQQLSHKRQRQTTHSAEEEDDMNFTDDAASAHRRIIDLDVETNNARRTVRPRQQLQTPPRPTLPPHTPLAQMHQSMRSMSSSSGPPWDASVPAHVPWFTGRLGMTHIDPQTAQQQQSAANLPPRIRITDLIDRYTAIKACVSAFVIEDYWLHSLFTDTSKLCIVRPKPGNVPNGIHALPVSDQTLHVFPPMAANGFGVMHTKFMLIWYPKFLRVVIMSANLIEFDWTGIENIVFYQDFPLVDPSISESVSVSRRAEIRNTTMGSFGMDLVRVLERMRVPENVIRGLYDFDFRNSRAEIVASVPASVAVSTISKSLATPQDPASTEQPNGVWGLVDLSEKIKQIATRYQLDLDDLTATFHTSSLGNVTQPWLASLLSACRGNIDASISAAHANQVDPTVLNDVSILFPTTRTVLNSHYGGEGASTIWFTSKFWNSASFPRQVLRDSVSKCPGMLSHAKFIVCYPRHQSNQVTSSSMICMSPDDGQRADGWMYIGSHNTSKAAWGSFTKHSKPSASKSLNSTSGYRFSVNNYELGVVFPIRSLPSNDWGTGNMPSMTIPVELPAPVYRQNDTPWSLDRL